MPRTSFLLNNDARAFLEISWSEERVHIKENLQIRYQDTLLGEFPTQSELEKGQKFELPDASMVEIKLTDREFNILHNGKPLRYIPDVKGNQSGIFFLALSFFLMAVYTLFNSSLYHYIDPYRPPLSETMHPLFFGVGLCLSILGVGIGIALKRYEILGYIGLYSFALLSMLTILVVSLYTGENITATNILILFLWLFGLIYNLYKYYRRNKN